MIRYDVFIARVFAGLCANKKGSQSLCDDYQKKRNLLMQFLIIANGV